MTKKSGSLLHLQIGQEVIYLLLAISTAAAIILAVLLAAMSVQIETLKAEKRNDQPPIITLDEAQGYYFSSAKADVSPKFVSQLSEKIIPQLAKYKSEYRVDVVEVIGHTDEQSLGTQPSNLDSKLLPFLWTDAQDPLPVFADNVGLGMLRAAVVARVLRQDTRLRGVVILPMSAGQTVELNDSLARLSGGRNIKERRRIEIRMRRRNPDQSP